MKKLYTITMSLALAASTLVNATEVVKLHDAGSMKVNTELLQSNLSKANASIKATAMQHKAPSRALSYDDLILAPEGDTHYYNRVSDAVSDDGGYYVVYPEQMAISTVSFTEDGTVYIEDPILSFAAGTYIKGTLADGKITVELPQLLYLDGDPDYDAPEDVMGFYAYCYEVEYDEDLVVSAELTESQTITYTVDGDNITLDNPNGNLMIGLGIEDGFFLGYGETAAYLEYMDIKPVEAPAGLGTEQWVITSSATNSGKYVYVGFDGDDVYVRGLSTDLASAWIKGTKSGDKISFPSKQCMGVVPSAGLVMYLMSGEFNYNEEGVVVSANVFDSLDFTYDEANKTMSTTQTAFVNGSDEEIYYFNYWLAPVIRQQKETADSYKPLTPEFTEYVPFNAASNMGGVAMSIPAFSRESNGDLYLLDSANMYWRVYFDDELYTIYPDEYKGIAAEMTDIPYNIMSTYILYYSGHHVFYYFVDGFETIGIQSLYRDNGKDYASNIAVFNVNTQEISEKTVDTPTGIENVSSDKLAVGREYFDLMGRRVSKPAEGLYIQKTTFGDGSVEAVKVIR